MEAVNLYSFAILTLFMLAVFALQFINIWVSKTESKQQRDHDTARMEDFKATTKSYSDVIANALKESVSPLVQRVESTFEKVEEGLTITKTGFAQADRALTLVLNNQTEQKEAQAKEIALEMDTKNLLEGLAKDIQEIQAKVTALENTTNQQFATLEKKLAEVVELIQKIEKEKPTHE